MSAHSCSWCVSDTEDSVHLVMDASAYGVCGYMVSDKRCRRPAAYEVGLAYCQSEHCLNDPAHDEDCPVDHERAVVCNEHGLLMRSRPDLWQCFRSIRSLAGAR